MSAYADDARESGDHLDAVVAEQEARNVKEAAEAKAAAKARSSLPPRLGRRDIREVVAQAVGELSVRREYGVTGWSTGINSLDEHTRRVMAPGRVICVAGDTKSGKTAFAGQLVLALAAQGVPVLLGSFEDEQQDTMLRYLANLSSSNVGTLRDGFTRPDGSKLPIPEEFDASAQQLAAMNVELIAASGTVEQIAVEASDWWEHQAAAGGTFGALVIDQLSHIIPSDRVTFARRFPGYPPPPAMDRTVDMLEWQVSMLQRIAKKLNLLVIVLHQLNTHHEEWEKPTKRSVRGSQGIGHKVDALLIPWRPDKLPNVARGLGEPKWVLNTEGRAWIVCPMGRQVTEFTLEVTWHGGHQRYADLGEQYRAPWQKPTPLNDDQVKGMALLAELKGRWLSRSDGLMALANGATADDMPLALELSSVNDPVGEQPLAIAGGDGAVQRPVSRSGTPSRHEPPTWSPKPF